MADISKITLPSGTSYNIKDATARSGLSGKIDAPSSPSSGDVLTYNGSAWVADEAPKGIFIATYGTTTAAQVEAAYQAGMMCIVEYSDRVYVHSLRASAGLHNFTTVYNDGSGSNYLYQVAVNNSSWTNSSVKLAPISSPAFTGNPTATTQAAGNNSTRIATTAFVQTAIANVLSGGVVFRGETTTSLTDGATTNPITINGNSYTAVQGDLVISGKKEFVFDGTHWIELGDLDALGDLAWKDTASASYTPAGTVSQPTFSGSSLTSTGSFTPSGSVSISSSSTRYIRAGTTTTYNANYADITPAGTVSKPNVTVTPSTSSITPFGSAGSLPSFSATVSNENLTLSFDAGSLPSGGTAVSVMTGATAELASTPTFTGTDKYLGLSNVTSGGTGTAAVPYSYSATFTGTEGNVSVTGTPAGTVSQPTFSGTAATISVS